MAIEPYWMPKNLKRIRTGLRALRPESKWDYDFKEQMLLGDIKTITGQVPFDDLGAFFGSVKAKAMWVPFRIMQNGVFDGAKFSSVKPIETCCHSLGFYIPALMIHPKFRDRIPPTLLASLGIPIKDTEIVREGFAVMLILRLIF